MACKTSTFHDPFTVTRKQTRGKEEMKSTKCAPTEVMYLHSKYLNYIHIFTYG
jgi:hypothetical protein